MGLFNLKSSYMSYLAIFPSFEYLDVMGLRPCIDSFNAGIDLYVRMWCLTYRSHNIQTSKVDPSTERVK